MDHHVARNKIYIQTSFDILIINLIRWRICYTWINLTIGFQFKGFKIRLLRKLDLPSYAYHFLLYRNFINISSSENARSKVYFSVEIELVNVQSSIEYFSLEKRAIYKLAYGRMGGTKGWSVTSKPACRVWLDVCRIQSKCMWITALTWTRLVCQPCSARN